MSQAEGALEGLEGGGQVAILNPLVGEITQALMDLGGAAHRDLVTAYVAKRRGAYRPSEGLRRELDEAFAAYCQGAGDPRAPTLLHLPHGPDTYRWALTDWAYALLQARIGVGRR